LSAATRNTDNTGGRGSGVVIIMETAVRAAEQLSVFKGYIF
jgi:hypothetical protein